MTIRVSKIKKAIIVIFICLLVFVIVLGVMAKNGNNFLSNSVNTVLSPIQSVVSTIVEPINKFVDYTNDMKNLKIENDYLKSELETLKKERRNQEEYKKENTRLKKILQLTDDLDKCETVAAKIVSYEPHNWFHTLIINKGEKNGIKKDDIVITNEGLVGKVSEVGINWARVSTILDSGNSVGIKLTRTGDVGISQGDAELLKNKKLCVNYISKESALINGDRIETSGLGGIYPPGLSVGTIEEIRVDNTGGLVKAIIEPIVNFKEIYEVLVVTYWENSVFDVEKAKVEYNLYKEEQDTGMRNDSLKENQDTDKELKDEFENKSNEQGDSEE